MLGNGEPFTRPEGSLQLARRVLHVTDPAEADEAARELCRRCPKLDTLPALIGEWFTGQLSTGLFDRLADAFDDVRHERELAALDTTLTEGATA